MKYLINDDFINQIQKRIKNRSEIWGVYCFGSVAKGETFKESDLDLAFLVEDRRKVNTDQIYDLIRDLSFPKDLDITVIDRYSSPLLLFEIVAHGRCIVVNDEENTTNFESFVLDNYYDTSHLRNIYAYYLKDKFPLRYAHK